MKKEELISLNGSGDGSGIEELKEKDIIKVMNKEIFNMKKGDVIGFSNEYYQKHWIIKRDK